MVPVTAGYTMEKCCDIFSILSLPFSLHWAQSQTLVFGITQKTSKFSMSTMRKKVERKKRNLNLRKDTNQKSQ